MKIDLLQFGDAAALAEEAGSAWVNEISRLSQSNGQVCVALSGGRIAGRFFDEVVRHAHARELRLEHLEFFWADERCVPPSDPESNFRLADERLLRPLGIDSTRVHRVCGELAPRAAATQAESVVRAIAPMNSAGQPVLDLVLLGMGEDGHVASLFPNEAEAAVSSGAVYRAVIGPKPPPNRVTLGYGALAAAQQVWVFASGEGKEEALRRSLAQDGSTPLGRMLRLRERTRIFTEIAV
jgi:6-phosphogluconolactonase